MHKKQKGFTIVELLIVIVVIGVLAAITVVAYNGVQKRAQATKTAADVQNYVKAIHLARSSTGLILREITLNTWSTGRCYQASDNPGNIEPRNLPKSHICWVTYYSNLSRIGAAANMNLDALRSGDFRGNPYALDENEGETCQPDKVMTFNGDGTAAYTTAYDIPRIAAC